MNLLVFSLHPSRSWPLHCCFFSVSNLPRHPPYNHRNGSISNAHTSSSFLNLAVLPPPFSSSSLSTLLVYDLLLLPSGKCGCLTQCAAHERARVCKRGWSFGVTTPQLDSVSAAKRTPSLSPSFIRSLTSSCIDSLACSRIPMSGRGGRSEGRTERGSERRNGCWRWGGGHFVRPEGPWKSSARERTRA